MKHEGRFWRGMPAATTQTARFPPDALKFFKEIKTHNDREWFQKNKARYETNVRDPSFQFILAIEPGLAKISKQLIVDARPVGGSVMRIYRDTRFAKDKSPYKTYAAFHFSHRMSSEEAHRPGFYAHIEPGESGVWAGAWHPAREDATAIREAIVKKPDAWKKAKDGRDLVTEEMSEMLKRVPPGFDPDHPLADDLRHKDFIVFEKFSDKDVVAPDFTERFLDACKKLAPFNAFLADAMGVPW